MVNVSAPSMADTASARSPAAFTTQRAESSSPAAERMRHSSPSRRAVAASQLVSRRTPLATADSTSAKTNRYGSMIPPEGANSPPTTSRLRAGSRASSLSRPTTWMSGAPLASPCSYRWSTVFISSTEKAATTMPARRNGKPSSAWSASKALFPSISRRAFSDDGEWWKPAWMIPELALETPNETSTQRSRSAMRSW